MGAIIAGAGEAEQQHVYAFGNNLGLAFQLQDDWLDSFGNPSTFGKQKGGDILANKKTFLLVHALEKAGQSDKKVILDLLAAETGDKVDRMIEIFISSGVGVAAQSAKNQYMEKAYAHLDLIGVPAAKKIALKELAGYLLERER
jgi:geranylgeranyl diphosphate synthase type II